MKKVLLILFLCFYTSSFAKMQMSKNTYDILIKAQDLIEKNDYKSSKKILEELLKNESKNEYEKSYILQTLSNIYIHNDDYEKVANAYKRILKYNTFEEETLDNIKYSLSKIMLTLENFKESIELAGELKNSKNIDKSGLYEVLVIAHFHLKNYKKAISYSKKYLALNTKVSESIYKILYSSYIELKDYRSATKTMEKMVRIFNTNENYWVQLASLYQEQNRLKDSLATLELAYKNGVLKNKNNILYFINISLQNGVYKKANDLLTKAIKNGLIKEDKNIFELLVSSHINAKDTDLAIKKIHDSKYKDQSKYKLILANLYYEKQEFKKSIEVLEQIDEKNHTKTAGEKEILKALCYYELNDKDTSIKILKQATNNPHYKKRAKSLLKSLES